MWPLSGCLGRQNRKEYSLGVLRISFVRGYNAIDYFVNSPCCSVILVAPRRQSIVLSTRFHCWSRSCHVDSGCVVALQCYSQHHLCSFSYLQQGSFICGPCPSGFVGNGDEGCTSVDPCAVGSHSCDVNAKCQPTFGSSYICEVSNNMSCLILWKYLRLYCSQWYSLPPLSITASGHVSIY